MRKFLAIALCMLLGCSAPIRFGTPETEDKLFEVRDSASLKKKAANNKYLVVIPGRQSVFNGKACPIDKLDQESVGAPDNYVEADLRETIKLSVSKGYEAFMAESDSELEKFFDKLVKLSNDQTQLIVAMSGECDEKGFNINLVHAGSLNVVPPDKKLLAVKIIAHLGLIKGTKAVIINGCQSECFAEAARKDPDFKGVVIAACPIGYATTQCEHTGTSAIYAGFLGLYQDDHTSIKNLSTANISAGFWFENMRHRISGIGENGLPISYCPVIYSTAEFLF